MRRPVTRFSTVAEMGGRADGMASVSAASRVTGTLSFERRRALIS